MFLFFLAFGVAMWLVICTRSALTMLPEAVQTEMIGFLCYLVACQSLYWPELMFWTCSSEFHIWTGTTVNMLLLFCPPHDSWAAALDAGDGIVAPNLPSVTHRNMRIPNTGDSCAVCRYKTGSMDILRSAFWDKEKKRLRALSHTTPPFARHECVRLQSTRALFSPTIFPPALVISVRDGLYCYYFFPFQHYFPPKESFQHIWKVSPLTERFGLLDWLFRIKNGPMDAKSVISGSRPHCADQFPITKPLCLGPC